VIIISKWIWLVLFSIVIVGCITTEKPQSSSPPSCESAGDCKVSGNCSVADCVNGQCQIQKKADCCGNGICEEASGENFCTCASDCPGSCEGPVDFILPGGTKQKAKYFEYGCSKTRCIIRYDLTEIDPREEYHELSKDNIVMGLTVSYIVPYVIRQQKMGIELELKDFDKEKVRMPVQINEIRIMENNLLLGRERNINYGLKNISKKFYTEIPIDYSMSLPEEQKSVSIEIDYQYTVQKKVQVKDEDGKPELDLYGQPTYVYLAESTLISKDKKTLQSRIFFLDPDYNEVKVDFSQD
jgi:hypothetical protein